MSPMSGYYGCVFDVEVFYHKCAVLTSNPRSGYKLAFHAVFAGDIE